MRDYFFQQFLNHFWLRPENALLLSLRAESYWRTLQYFKTNVGTIDVSCGDGVFSFITFGGQLSINTDMFRSIKLGERKGDFDAFDYFDQTYFVEIEKEPDRKYEYGLDWKRNLLDKASKLNFYSHLIEHDNNFPIPLPDESMSFVYTNSAYWVQNFVGHLQDLVRITKKGGYIVLQIKTDKIKQLSSKHYLPFMGRKFHEIIDAGRFSTWKGLKSKEEIIDIINSIKNVKICHMEPVYGDILAMIWDIGLRPLFNPLVKMANNISMEQRAEVKREWIDIIYNLFGELLMQYSPKEQSAIEYTIVLEKE